MSSPDPKRAAEAAALVRWSNYFRTAHEHSWPIAMLSMAKEIYSRDQKAVDQAAKQHGYVLMSVGGAVLNFVNDSKSVTQQHDEHSQ